MKRALLFLFILLALWFTWQLFPSDKIDFSTQVKPIFNKNCIACHGGVRQKAGFSLLFSKDALAPTESGKPAIIPGHPEQSELISRITHKDPEERMPYRHDPLPEKDIEILRQWIEEGAEWGDHWAYVPVKKTEPPSPAWYDFAGRSWVRNDIDRFVLARLDEHKLKPSSDASKEVLLRRLSLDVTGLPAPESIAKKYLEDESDGAYEKLVDALLASPHYGERWTAPWMDLARYADTKGYERDYIREIWRYRDWLIQAFNNDMPYDQFIREQLAGDLLPNPTDQQYLATAFHRNTMTNDEGGTDNEEFRTAAVIDRVNTTWEALMGTTFACTQCHSHPYDPFRQEEYYKFAAFFNNTRDEDSYADYPVLREFKSKEDSAALAKIVAWIDGPRSNEIYKFVKTGQPAINTLLATCIRNSAISDTKWLIFRNHALAKFSQVDLTGRNHLTFRYMSWRDKGTILFHLDTEDGPVVGKITPPDTKGTWTLDEIPFIPANGKHDLYLTYEHPTLNNPLDDGAMFDWFYFAADFPGKEKPEYASMRKEYWRLLNAEAITTPIMMDNPPEMARKSYVFIRGNWLDKGKEVQPGTPGSLHAFPEGAPANRLGLSQWILSDQNPLTSRTLVNRVWEQIFGTGLVETLEDMGTQGLQPSNVELLDYLAWNFMHEDGWKMKTLIRKIVMSSTYRQDSKVTEDRLEKDPSNRYLSRGPRVRLSAEQIRDQTLAVSGLLSSKMYGPGVKPYQPDGIWQSPYNGLKWKRDKGENGHRRALYTYWKRTAAYPSMMLFDGVQREVCAARRIRTNTPLQALVTLNDSSYVEAAQQLALKMKTSSTKPDEQIANGYRFAMGRAITPERLAVLRRLYDKTTATFQKTSAEIAAVEPLLPLELVATAILNLDEFVTKD